MMFPNTMSEKDRFLFVEAMSLILTMVEEHMDGHLFGAVALHKFEGDDLVDSSEFHIEIHNAELCAEEEACNAPSTETVQ